MISINATLVVQVINFLILIFILNKILFGPILKTLEEREQSIADTQAEMKRLQVEAHEKAELLESQLSQARRESSARKAEAQAEASSQAEAILDKAQAEATDHFRDAQNRTEAQVEQARSSLSEFKDAIVEMVLLKVMGRKI